MFKDSLQIFLIFGWLLFHFLSVKSECRWSAAVTAQPGTACSCFTLSPRLCAAHQRRHTQILIDRRTVIRRMTLGLNQVLLWVHMGIMFTHSCTCPNDITLTEVFKSECNPVVSFQICDSNQPQDGATTTQFAALTAKSTRISNRINL